jgi:pilus assembly protein TadC
VASGQGPSLLEERPSIRAPEPRDWRRGFFASWILLLALGAWLALSPALIGYGDGWWVPPLIGALLVIVSAAALAEIVPNAVAASAASALAVLLFAGGLALADSGVASWSVAAGGALAVFLAIVAAASPETTS